MSVVSPTKQSSNASNRYLSYHQLAELTGLPVGSLRNRKSAGKSMPRAYRIGQRILFDAEDSIRWIESTPA